MRWCIALATLAACGRNGFEAKLDAALSDATSASIDAATDAATDAGPDALTVAAVDVAFDSSTGTTTYVGLSAGNWTTSGMYANANDGSQWLGSANGNASGSFPGLRVTQQLGGIVENRAYTVVFYVTQYEAGYSGIMLSDFTILRVGGPNGTVTWTDTPTPTVTDAWIAWTGTYTPVPADVGGPFYFDAEFNLDGMHTIGIDGPISATP